jgi:GT2 family glycosyltransferase
MSLAGNGEVGVVAPSVRSPGGNLENSARRFPTPLSIALKMIGRRTDPEYPITDAVLHPDWVAGMFMLFRREAYQSIGGFDERYFLYYEDVDICWRLRRAGLDVAQATTVDVTHAARRDSHRRISYLSHHVRGMSRFFSRRLSCSLSPRRP